MKRPKYAELVNKTKVQKKEGCFIKQTYYKHIKVS